MKHIRIENTIYSRCGLREDEGAEMVNEYFHAIESDCKRCHGASMRYKVMKQSNTRLQADASPKSRAKNKVHSGLRR